MSPIDTYIQSLPDTVQDRLKKLRSAIIKTVPDVTEMMSYGVPAFKKNNNAFLYAAFKNHIGIYPTPKMIEAFKEELKLYETSKGTVKFPHDKELPVDLILKIAKYKLES